MQLLAYRDPTGRVFILDESYALPPLAEGYEWTMVVQPPTVHAPGDDPHPDRPPARPQRNSWLDAVLPLLTPRPGQSAQERAEELIDAIPADLRSRLGQIVRAFQGPPTLPPFPGT